MKVSKEERMSRFLKHVSKYASIGVNLTSLALGCSVKVDLYNVLYPALSIVKRELGELHIKIAPREDVAVLRGSELDLMRVITSVDSPKLPINTISDFNPDALILLVESFQGNASDPDSFANIMIRLFKELAKVNKELVIGKGHSIVSTQPNASIHVLDFIKVKNKDDAYTLVNNDTIQVIDPMDEIASRRQVSVALNNALNDLFSKGAFKDLEFYPVYDAPGEYKHGLFNEVKAYVNELGGRLHDVEQPNLGYLLIGSTVASRLDREPPMFYNEVKEGFKIIVTRPFGELSIIGTYVALHVDEELYDKFEREVMTVDELEEIKEYALNQMAKPNIDVAKVIYNHLPELGRRFNDDEHVAATIDISGPGIFVFKELAETANVKIRLSNIPLISPEVAEFAASNYIISDATAGTNGAVALVVSSGLVDDVLDELGKIPGLKPMVIGEVVGRGEGTLIVPDYVTRYIKDKVMLTKLTIASNILQGVSRQAALRLARAEIMVTGKVQGVGFRPLVRRNAKSLGLTGFARNNEDGSVLIIVEGEEGNIKAFIESLRNINIAEVRELNIKWSSYKGEFQDFTIE
ncbi:SelD-related putative sulfur metabolism protein [Caldivirga maquilingensis]|uniref:acylphosphatase n=1 Tax=Caldivirga maquilingensis (strain ATCC 700844 / DSM 13496 / JCM 10307 / IC-167) TaxID=397948 RepID=A8MDU7_CALMQ|nr:SelD-related putative sulfur metabolism protein [Caldivirga maquilingensis]ABW01953.1 acylphosphatase [Caldivirga maquilingensis IC-167]